MAESKGRPGSAAQRPTGGDKAVATQKKQYFRRKKVCRFCAEKNVTVDFKDQQGLKYFVTERGKIIPRRISGVCAPHQRRLTDRKKQTPICRMQSRFLCPAQPTLRKMSAPERSGISSFAPGQRTVWISIA